MVVETRESRYVDLIFSARQTTVMRIIGEIHDRVEMTSWSSHSFFEPFGSKFSFEMTKKSAPPQESLFNSLVFLKKGDAFSYCLKLGQFMPQKLLCKK